MTREKFPEKIPFRLTRMLTNAMEVQLVTLERTFYKIKTDTGVWFGYRC